MKTALITGGLTYAAAHYIFDTSNRAAIFWAVGIAGVGYYIATQKPASATSLDNSPLL